MVYMTIQEVSDMSSVSRSTLYRWAHNWENDQVGPRPYRLGPRQIRYRSDDVYKWLQL